MRDRLIELVNSKLKDEFDNVPLKSAINIANHLLANGVIAPSCKLGDKMYVLMHKRRDEYDYKEGVNEIIVRHIRIRTDGIFVSDFWGFMNWKIGERAFHTKEEAEKVFAERSNQNGN